MIVTKEIDLSGVHVIFLLYLLRRKNSEKNFCVGCKCCTNFKFSNRHQMALERTLSNCIFGFFSKKIDLPTLFPFYHSKYLSVILNYQSLKFKLFYEVLKILKICKYFTNLRRCFLGVQIMHYE